MSLCNVSRCLLTLKKVRHILPHVGTPDVFSNREAGIGAGLGKPRELHVIVVIQLKIVLYVRNCLIRTF